MLQSTKKNNNHTNKLLDLIINSNEKSLSFIFLGAKGIGKSEITKQTAYILLKTTDLTTHPNILWIDTEKGSIAVAEIRNISNFMYKTTYYNKLPKLIVIDCVNNLNIHSLNALLKILEEPTKNTYFILISHNLKTLPDTIKSRCIVVNVSPPDLIKTRDIIKQQLPELSDEKLNEYLSISHVPGIVVELASNNVLEVYKEMLDLMGANSKISNKLYEFIEKNFSSIEQLKIFQILINGLIHKAILDPCLPRESEVRRMDNKSRLIHGEEKIIKMQVTKKNTQQLLELSQEIDSLVINSKTLGLDVRGVILIIINKLMK